jgi:hypothetical protein
MKPVDFVNPWTISGKRPAVAIENAQAARQQISDDLMPISA